VLYAAGRQNLLGHRPLAAAMRSQPDALALDLSEVAERVGRFVEDPVDMIVDASQRPQIRRLSGVRDASLHDGGLDVGGGVVEQADIFLRAVGQFHTQIDLGARKDFPVLVADTLIDLVAPRRWRSKIVMAARE